MTDIKTVLTAAADRLETQPELWKALAPAPEGCTCIALAIEDCSWKFDAPEGIVTLACQAVALHLGLVWPNTRSIYGALPEWNDRPETTLEDAVRALRETAEAL